MKIKKWIHTLALAAAIGGGTMTADGSLYYAVWQMPDLIILGWFKIDYPNEYAFGYTVKNQGSVASSPCSIRFEFASGPREFSVPGLAPGDSRLQFLLVPKGRGSLGFPQSMTIDSLNQVIESKEGNNTLLVP